jgi:hypothetical protein
MYAKLERSPFIHVVATVDLGRKSGAIRYVNPATTGMTSDHPGHPDVEMSVEDESGGHKKTWHPIVRFASPEPDGTPQTTGLIQEDIPYEPWMKVVRLLVNGKEVGKYEASSPDPSPAASAAPSAGGVEAPALTLGAGGPGSPRRRSLLMHGQARKQEGLTYTVQARPEGSDAWQTIAVGRDTPDVDIDRNQFPGARRVDVRVIQTTGFQERILAEETIDLGS